MIIQRCWAHILREAEDLAMAAGKGSLEEELHRGLRGIFHAAKQIAADTADSGGADADTCMDLKMQVLAMASSYGKHPFAGTLRNAAPNLFTFLRYPGMPPTNNAAEGDIRDGVVLERKIRQKITTKEGMHVFAVIHSFTQTCRKPASGSLEADGQHREGPRLEHIRRGAAPEHTRAGRLPACTGAGVQARAGAGVQARASATTTNAIRHAERRSCLPFP